MPARMYEYATQCPWRARTTDNGTAQHLNNNFHLRNSNNPVMRRTDEQTYSTIRAPRQDKHSSSTKTMPSQGTVFPCANWNVHGVQKHSRIFVRHAAPVKEGSNAREKLSCCRNNSSRNNFVIVVNYCCAEIAGSSHRLQVYICTYLLVLHAVHAHGGGWAFSAAVVSSRQRKATRILWQYVISIKCMTTLSHVGELNVCIGKMRCSTHMHSNVRNAKGKHFDVIYCDSW